ncbi:hypothetical protein [Haloarchaeobius baliensis]|uniref:hypothetical protein n=1 Tax=Haloarchaeobius baliensis TaxID=1670458 RepID=UPI003F883B00
MTHFLDASAHLDSSAPLGHRLVACYAIAVSASPLYQVLVRVGGGGLDTLNAIFIAGWVPLFLAIAWGVLHRHPWGLPGALWIATHGVRDVVAGLVRRPGDPLAVVAGEPAVDIVIFAGSLAVLGYVLSRFAVGVYD